MCKNTFTGMTFSVSMGVSSQGVQTFSISGPHCKKNSSLGPHVKYTNINKNWWAKEVNYDFVLGSIPSHPGLHAPMGLGLDTAATVSTKHFTPCKLQIITLCYIFSGDIYVWNIYFTGIFSKWNSGIIFENSSNTYGKYLFSNLLYNYKIK